MLGGPDDRRCVDAVARRDALADVLTRYHGVTLDEVLELISYLRDAGDHVIAGGSLALGLGNRLSDLDLVIVGDGAIKPSRVPLEHFSGSLRIDVWKMNRRLIDELFARAAEGLAGTRRLHESFANVDDETNLKLLHRVAFGILLDGSAPDADRDAEYGTVARTLLIREYAERMRESALLAQLARLVDDRVTAMVDARLSVEQALHAVVAARGLPFTGDKWLRERLQHDARDLLPAHERVASLPGSDAAGVDAFVTDAIAICTELTGVELDLASLAADACWEIEELELLRVGDHALLVAAPTGAMWTLEPEEADAWSQLSAGPDGRRAGRVHADRAAMELCYRLSAEGVAHLRWTRGQALSSLRLRGGTAA